MMEGETDLCSAAAVFRGTEEYAAAFDLEVWKAQQQARLRSELKDERAQLQKAIEADVRKKEEHRLVELEALRQDLEQMARRLQLREEALQRRISQFESRESAFEERRVKVAEQHEHHLVSLEGRTRRQLEESVVRQDLLKAQLSDRESIIAHLEERLRAAEGEYDKLQRHMSRTIADDGGKERVDQLEVLLASSNTAISNLQLQLKERETNLALVRKERDQLEHACKLYKDQLNQLAQRYTELQEQWNQRERTLLEEDRRRLEEAKRRHQLVARQVGDGAKPVHRYELLGCQAAENIAPRLVEGMLLHGGVGSGENNDAYDCRALLKELQGDVTRSLQNLELPLLRQEVVVRAAMRHEIRVPISCVLAASLAQRHAIPHRTLFLDASHPFIQYLDSDDTRLPQHSVLTASLQPAEAYETYVGEDDWEGKELDDGTDAEDHPAPRFDDVVQWVMDTIDVVGGVGDGVVLCGRHVVADDCGWAVISRTPTLLTPRDVFVAMRNSSKFLRDVHHQLHGEATTTRAETAVVQVEITLAKALGGNPAKEFRVFLPYRLGRDDKTLHADAWDDHAYAGISQRKTDMCFPSLMSWDESTHDENYCVVMRHIKHAMLLEEVLGKYAGLREAFLQRAAASVCESKSSVLLLSVDVLFESPSLPVHLLSAKVMCFRHDDIRDPTCAFPFILVDDDDTAVDRTGAGGGGGSSSSNDDSGDESVMESLLCDSVGFFRLFRDAVNWNNHVEMCRQRRCASDAGESGGCGSRRKGCFFVIASERSDLAPTKEALAKRGLPLEFIRPDLVLQGGEKFQQEWRDKLMQCISMEQHTAI